MLLLQMISVCCKWKVQMILASCKWVCKWLAHDFKTCSWLLQMTNGFAHGKCKWPLMDNFALVTTMAEINENSKFYWINKIMRGLGYLYLCGAVARCLKDCLNIWSFFDAVSRETLSMDMLVSVLQHTLPPDTENIIKYVIHHDSLPNH